MRKVVLLLSLMAAVTLSACNTARGWANGVGKDLEAAGNAISGTGKKVQEEVPPPK